MNKNYGCRCQREGKGKRWGIHIFKCLVLLISDILWLMLFSLSLFDIKLQALCAFSIRKKRQRKKLPRRRKRRRAGEVARWANEQHWAPEGCWRDENVGGWKNYPIYVGIIVNPNQTTSISWKVSKFFLFSFVVRGPMESGKSFFFVAHNGSNSFRGYTPLKLTAKGPLKNRLKPKRRWIIFQPSIFRVVFCC